MAAETPNAAAVHRVDVRNDDDDDDDDDGADGDRRDDVFSLVGIADGAREVVVVVACVMSSSESILEVALYLKEILGNYPLAGSGSLETGLAGGRRCDYYVLSDFFVE
mmetsp:Transcript_11312/g.22524  ORF Transcript_11312/g.22524 Transcript_11312/m.22524 type:complete len:108 (+) Transcript_11312:2956-3279(+)